jgi:molecular chaperone GrpE
MSEVIENENLSSEDSKLAEVGVEDTTDSNSLFEEELKKAKSEAEQFKDSWQRERAEFQNYKRRVLNESLEVKRESVKKVLMSLLEPLDSLDKVIGSNPNPAQEMTAFLEGVNLIRKQLNSVLEKENVFKLDPKGQIFDPSTMEAISSEESEEYNEETVIEVYRPGYMFKEGDRNISLRTAMVKVGKPKF